MKKIISMFGLCVLVFSSVPVMTFAAAPDCTDEDGDNFLVVADPDAENIADLRNSTCGTTIGLRGYEPEFCDCPNLREGANCHGAPLTIDNLKLLFDPTKVTGTLKGRNFNPNATDSPDDGIDNNCDGFDATRGDLAKGQDVAGLIETGVRVLGTIVAGVSTLFLIWGAIMYASAAGEEEKTRKARKTMTGAVIGLIIGVLAATLIGIVINWVRG